MLQMLQIQLSWFIQLQNTNRSTDFYLFSSTDRLRRKDRLHWADTDFR